MQEMWVQSLGREDSLKEGMATPVSLPEKFHGQRSLTCYSPWGCKKSDMTEVTEHTRTQKVKRWTCTVVLALELHES